MTITIECQCKQSIEIEANQNRFQQVREHGWEVISTHEPKLIPICKPCYDEIALCAKRIYEITGNRYVSISGLITREE